MTPFSSSGLLDVLHTCTKIHHRACVQGSCSGITGTFVYHKRPWKETKTLNGHVLSVRTCEVKEICTQACVCRLVVTYVPLLYIEKYMHHSLPVVASLLATTFRIPSNTHSGVTLFHSSGFELPNVVSVVTYEVYAYVQFTFSTQMYTDVYMIYRMFQNICRTCICTCTCVCACARLLSIVHVYTCIMCAMYNVHVRLTNLELSW